MSGPLDVDDVPTTGATVTSGVRDVEIIASRAARVGSVGVRRALPTRGRRTVGAWCFADHFGPARATPAHGIDIGPHPHMGLQTVTWLVAGEALHRDSLGSEQVIRPGQLNLMTAGHGVAHAEEGTGRYRGDLHGMQLWVAQPSSTRDGTPAFEHHPELPMVDLGTGEATVLVGELAGSRSPARRDTDHVGIDIALRAGTATLPTQPGFEYALVVLDGTVSVESRDVHPGQLAYLGTGWDELVVVSAATSRVLVLGGTPFPESVLMWWNFVARTRQEMGEARWDWATRSGRFGQVASSLPRVEVGPPPWERG